MEWLGSSASDGLSYFLFTTASSSVSEVAEALGAGPKLATRSSSKTSTETQRSWTVVVAANKMSLPRFFR